MNIDDPDPFYTATCSSATLQSSRQGFFLALAEDLEERLGKWVERDFAKLKTDEQRVRSCLRRKEVQQTLRPVAELFRPKSAATSQQRRAEGDRALGLGAVERALQLYSQAIIRAPPTGEDPTVDGGLCLPLALAARSEALLVLENFQLSLSDIQAALKEGFPEHLRYQLYWRMGRVYRGMGQSAKARVALELTAKLLSQGPKNAETAMSLLRLRAEQEGLDDVLPEQTTAQEEAESLPCLAGGQSIELPYAAVAVGVDRSEGAGRYAVARAAIKTGDVVLVEQPLAACLLPDMFGSHCHHCFKRLRAPVACPRCSGLAFCSTKCRDIACGSYHRYECRVLNLLIGSGMSILCHVALRMVTQEGLPRLLELKEALKTPPDAPTEGLVAAHQLEAHATRRPVSDFLHRTLMALFLNACLERGGFYPTDDDNDDTRPWVASLLLRHLQLLQFNAHEVYETLTEAPWRCKGSRMSYIGVGIYPSVARLNHECYPAVTRYFVGRAIVVCATRALSPGDVLAECYGPVFSKRPLAARRRVLASRYWFNCQCRPCQEDWPTFEGLSNLSFRLRCPTSGCPHLLPLPRQKKSGDGRTAPHSAKCPTCRRTVFLEDAVTTLALCEQDYARGLDAMESGQLDAAVAMFCSYLDLMHAIGYPPHKDVPLCQEALRTCMAFRGNVHVLPPTPVK